MFFAFIFVLGLITRDLFVFDRLASFFLFQENSQSRGSVTSPVEFIFLYRYSFRSDNSHVEGECVFPNDLPHYYSVVSIV